MHEIEPKALKVPLAATIQFHVHVCSLISVYGIYRKGRITAPGRFPYSFQEACEFFKVPCIWLVKVERLGQWRSPPKYI